MSDTNKAENSVEQSKENLTTVLQAYGHHKSIKAIVSQLDDQTCSRKDVLAQLLAEVEKIRSDSPFVLSWEFSPAIEIDSFRGQHNGERHLNLTDYQSAIQGRLKELRAKKSTLLGEKNTLFTPLEMWAESLVKGDNDDVLRLRGEHLPDGSKVKSLDYDLSGSTGHSMRVLLDELANGRTDSDSYAKRLGISEKQARRFHKALLDVQGFATERRKGFFSSQALTEDSEGEMSRIVKLLDAIATDVIKRSFDLAKDTLEGVALDVNLSLEHLSKIVQCAIIGREIRGLQSQLAKAQSDWATKLESVKQVGQIKPQATATESTQATATESTQAV